MRFNTKNNKRLWSGIKYNIWRIPDTKICFIHEIWSSLLIRCKRILYKIGKYMLDNLCKTHIGWQFVSIFALTDKKDLLHNTKYLLFIFHLQWQNNGTIIDFDIYLYCTISYILIASKCGRKAQCQFYSIHISAWNMVSFHG